jgi:hypothetical protein
MKTALPIVVFLFCVQLIAGCAGHLVSDGTITGPTVVRPLNCQAGMHGECSGEGNSRMCRCEKDTPATSPVMI